MAMETTTVSDDQDSRIVLGLMGITVLFALIGSEIETSKAAPGSSILTGPPKILAGGVVATSLLVLMTHAGDAGRQFAVGLALVSMVTATLVYGGPVWSAANNAFGSTPTGGTGATTPTTPGGNTAASAAIVATNLAAG